MSGGSDLRVAVKDGLGKQLCGGKGGVVEIELSGGAVIQFEARETDNGRIEIRSTGVPVTSLVVKPLASNLIEIGCER